MSRLLLALGNAFIAAYAADAMLSLLEELFRTATGSTALSMPRNLLAYVVVLSSLLVVPALALCRWLPPSALAPLVLSTFWLAFGAAPLPLWVDAEALPLTACAIQLAFAVLAFLRLRSLSGGRSWWIIARPDEPAFSLRRVALSSVAIVLVGAASLLVYLPVSLLTGVQLATDSFVRFDLSGVSLADRRYERDGQEIRLVGMMHIGESRRYQELVESFVGPATVVLTEGVTDHERRLETPLSYDGVAGSLGLDTQDAIESYLEDIQAGDEPQLPELRHADVDMSDLQPSTVAWLEEAAGVWDGDDVLAALRELYDSYLEDPQRWQAVVDDIIDRRNRHLLGVLRESLDDYEHIIVPWGALHLPFIQAEVLAMGFEPREHLHHPLTSWKTIAGALFR